MFPALTNIITKKIQTIIILISTDFKHLASAKIHVDTKFTYLY